MKKRVIKLISSVFIITCMMIGFCTSYASAVAESVLIAGAIEGALSASGIAAASAGFASLDSNAIWLDDVIKPDSSARSEWYRSITDGEVKWFTNYTIIDDIQYDKVVLDNDLSSSLNYFTTRIIEDYELEDGQSGTLFQYSGYYDDSGNIFPYVYSGYNYMIGPPATIIAEAETSAVCGPGLVRFYNVTTSGYASLDFVYNSTVLRSTTSTRIGALPQSKCAVYGVERSNGRIFVGYMTPGASYISSSASSNDFISSSQVTNASILYTNGTIDATLPSGYSYYYLLPSSYRPNSVSGSGTYSGQVVEDSINAISAGAGSDNLISGSEPYDTPVPPVPDTTIADTSYSTLHDELTTIKNQQAHTGDSVDLIGRSVDNIDSTLTDIEGQIVQSTDDIVDSVDTAGQSVVSEVGRLRTVVDTLGQSVTSILNGIRSAIDSGVQTVTDAVEAVESAIDGLAENVLEDIETAPINVFSTALDVIKTVFEPVLLALKSVIGLWHYVVEWVGSITPVFSAFFGIMSGTSYNMVLPIYAALAGPIVIAVYKRFGK